MSHGQFVAVESRDLRPFTLFHGMERSTKMVQWQSRFQHRWVNWTGRLISFTANGFTIKEYRDTLLFDMSVRVDKERQRALKAMYKPGEFVRFVGELDSYDDVLPTLFLVHGNILAKVAPYKLEESPLPAR